MKTFMYAYKSRDPKEGLMFHSDQGLQYTSYVFRKQLRDLALTQFSEPECLHDNAVAESFFSGHLSPTMFISITIRYMRRWKSETPSKF